MPYQITIGRNNDNKFAIPSDPKVSGQHAVLIVHDNGKLELIDNESLNGTFIYNGHQFVRIQPKQSYPVTPDSMIQLGPDTRFHVRRLVPGIGGGGGGVSKKPQPPKVDISYLRNVYIDYQETKMDLDSKITANSSLRGLTIVVSILAGGGGALLASALGFEKENEFVKWIFGGLLAIILIGILLTLVNSRDRKLKRQLRENNEKFAVKYVCPKCRFPFGQKIYENILAEGCCPKCKTKFYETPRH
ncbi:MAG: FHA domain-containing protein [Muribaculaceae bacterium]|nr:FHA domain-containing protein [Muribaculaceae bacterium]